MNSYQRLEINLLPPEMAPGPAVRVSSLFNAILIAAALVFIGIDLFMNMTSISALKATKRKNGEKITAEKTAVDEYNALKQIQDYTEGRGKLVGMASSTYVEFPVILDRVSRILPAGVSLVKASSGGNSGGGAEISLEFRTATDDPALMSQTLEGFKSSPMFRDVYLRTGAVEPQPLEELRVQFDIPYRFEGSGADQGFAADAYKFEIHATVNSPLEVEDLGTVMDKSEYMLPFELTTDPSAPPTAPPPGAAAPGGAAAAGGATPAATAGGAAPAAGGAS